MMNHRAHLSPVVLSAFLALAGCGDDGGTADSGTATDTGTPTDTGVGDDSSTPTDSGTADDSSAPTDSAVPDAGPATCPDLMPTQGADNVVISQIDLANDTIEFFNPTDTAIPLDGLVLCQRPQYTTIAATGIMVQPGAYATLDALGSVAFETSGAGELGLYNAASYGARTAMVDFVCWDGDRADSRKSVAEMANGGGEVLWAGPCAGAVGMGVVGRNISVAGTAAAEYDVAGPLEAHACP